VHVRGKRTQREAGGAISGPDITSDIGVSSGLDIGNPIGGAAARPHQDCTCSPIGAVAAEVKERRAIFAANANANADTPTNNP
jgi:hypothetical protein